MLRLSQKLVVLLGVLILFAALAGPGAAQTVIVAPAPRVAYYAPPVAGYCYTPTVSYYAPPVVSYYYPAATVAQVPAATVTTYRYGILPRRRVTVTTYGSAPVVASPPPIVRYYGPVYVYR